MDTTVLTNWLTHTLSRISPEIIWLWILTSLGGLVYALKLWLRARQDVRRQHSALNVALTNALANAHTRAIHAHVAKANLQRVEVRVGMFLWFLVIGVCALGLLAFAPGLLRAVLQLVYVLAFLIVNGLVAYNSYRDERNDRVTQTMLRQEEHRGQEGC